MHGVALDYSVTSIAAYQFYDLSFLAQSEPDTPPPTTPPKEPEKDQSLSSQKPAAKKKPEKAQSLSSQQPAAKEVRSQAATSITIGTLLTVQPFGAGDLEARKLTMV